MVLLCALCPLPRGALASRFLKRRCAAAGLLARLFTHPLDTVKARLQVQAAVRLAVRASSAWTLRAPPPAQRSTRERALAPQDVAAGAVPSWAALPYAGTSDALTKVLRSEGVAGFYR